MSFSRCRRAASEPVGALRPFRAARAAGRSSDTYPFLIFSILRARGNFVEAVRWMLRDYGRKTLYLRVLWKTVIISVDPRRHGTCFAIARGHEASYRVPNC